MLEEVQDASEVQERGNEENVKGQSVWIPLEKLDDGMCSCSDGDDNPS
jgi:hypothetical protein